MNIKIDDCGRKESGINEKADCTVRAVAACFDLPYQEAHSKLAELGRKPRQRFKFSTVAPKLGLEQRADLSCMTLAKALPEMTDGRFIVRVSHHVFAVVNGTIVDKFTPKNGARIRMVYQTPTPL